MRGASPVSGQRGVCRAEDVDQDGRAGEHGDQQEPGRGVGLLVEAGRGQMGLLALADDAGEEDEQRERRARDIR